MTGNSHPPHANTALSGTVRVSFIILTWNSERFLQPCFESIIAKCDQEKIAFEIIVIDNGSTDNSDTIFNRFRARFPVRFHCICLKENRGTTYSRNLGLKQARGRLICILDSDTEFGEGSLLEIIDRLENDHALGILAPRLLLADRTIQNSVKKFPTFWHKLLKIGKIVFRTQKLDFDFYPDFPFQKETVVDTAISACWFFRRDLLKEVGYLDEKIFYSPEDLDYSVRIRQAGKVIVYFPHFTVLHHTQQISHQKPFSLVSFSHFWGLIYYFKKHGGWFSTNRLQQDRQ